MDVEKRAFIEKFGKYAVAGAGMVVLMSPTASSAGNYGCKRVAGGGKKHHIFSHNRRAKWSKME